MRYHDISKEDMLNGDGLRVCLWVSGCHHACKGCQNPITWNPDDGIMFGCSEEKEIFRELEKEHVTGITFTGGDPLAAENLIDVYELIHKIKCSFPQKNIWLYTGYKWEDIRPKNRLLTFINCFDEKNFRSSIVSSSDILVDGCFEKDKLDSTLKWRGSSNQRVIDVKESLIQNKLILHCD